MSPCNGSTGKADLQTIFDSISLKDFNKLRSVLNPLTLHDRRCIVNQKIHGKSTLYHAIECGSKPIVKYLLVDCMANVLQDSWNGTTSDWPLRKVVEKLDIFMLFIMKRYSGHPLRRYKIEETVDYTLKMEYHSVIWFLGLRFHLLRSIRTNCQHKMLRLTNLKGRKSYKLRSELFLELIAHGYLDKVKLLAASGVNIHLANDKGENGLCMAILNGNEEIVDFLIKNKVYSLRLFACSLEFCGAKLIIFQASEREGLNLWKRSVQIRNGFEDGFADKSSITELGLEFRTEKEIDESETLIDGSIYVQALIVFRRLLDQYSQLLMEAFLAVTAYASEIEPLPFLAILCEMFALLPIDHRKRPLLEKRARDGFHDLCVNHYLISFNDSIDYVPQLQILLLLLDPEFWKRLIPRMPEFFVYCYTFLMKVLLKYIPLLLSRPPHPNDEYWIKFNFGKIIEAKLHPYPAPLLHLAIVENLPPPIVLFLLACKADPNCRDAFGNTPLHLIGSLVGPRSYLLHMTHLLIRAGGHIDTINRLGVRPIERLFQNGLIRHPLKHMSLQCLAATAINAHRIFVDEEQVSRTVSEYVKIHSIP